MPEDLGIKQLPNLPKDIRGSSMVTHNGTILLCGGFQNEKKCLQLYHGTWKEHSTLNVERNRHSAVTTKEATFIFGGCHSYKTYEYLQKKTPHHGLWGRVESLEALIEDLQLLSNQDKRFG